MPLISVLMSVYNNEGTLERSIASILCQTFSDFEFIIIDDGSTDATAQIIHSYQDDRIRYIKNDSNKGLAYSLNRGIDLCQGRYIARMDADDFSMPERLKKQVMYMQENSNLIACGTWYIIYRNGVNKGLRKQVTGCKKLRTKMLFGNSINHPTVMFDKNKLNELNLRYNTEYKYVQDYDLWTRIALLGDLDNLNLPLLEYHYELSNQVSMDLRRHNYRKIQIEYIKNTFIIPLDDSRKMAEFMMPLGGVKVKDKFNLFLKGIKISLKAKNINYIYYYLRLVNRLIYA